MTKSFRKNIRRTITQSLGRYLAILAIIALGVGFFAGLKSTKPSMLSTAQTYLSNFKMYDLRVLSTIGFSQEELEQIRQLDGVWWVEGSISSDIICVTEAGEEKILRGYSVTKDVNQLDLTEGRMPENAKECVLDANAFSSDLLGQTISFAENNKQEDLDRYAYREYTVVGLAKSPLYLNTQRGTTTLGSGTLNGFMYLPLDGFSSDYYTELYFTFENTDPIYSQEYDSRMDGLKALLEPQIKSVVDQRYQDRMEEASQKIADAQEELESEKAESDQKLADAKKQLEEADDQLQSAKKELDTNRRTLDDAADALDANADSWEDAYASGLKQYKAGKAEFQTEIQKAETKLSESKEKLDVGALKYEENLKQYEHQKAQYDAGYDEYQKGLKEYETKLAQYEAGKKFLSEEQRESYEEQFRQSKVTLDATKDTLESAKLA